GGAAGRAVAGNEVGRARRVGAVAGFGDVATARDRGAANKQDRLLGVARAGVRRARAALGDVAYAGGGAADDRRGGELVGGAVGARSGAALRHVAHRGGGAADGVRRDEVVGRAGAGNAVAHLGDVAASGGGAAA